MMKKIVLAFAVIAAALAAVSMVAAAGPTYLTTPNNVYWNSGATRTTSYASTFGPAQGFFSYAGAPTGVVRYGVGYHWGENVRWPTYGNDPHTLEPGMYRPYYGYPAQGYGNPYWEYVKRY